MVELLGILLALLIVAAILAARRAVLWLGRRLGRLTTRQGRPLTPPQLRLRVSRRVARAQQDRIAALTAELERTRARLRVAERERDTLRATEGTEGRFQRAKRAFALHFHPDRLRGHPEARVRRRIFQEFWPELQRIERS